MNREKTGNSGLKVSAIGLGLLPFGHGPATNKTDAVCLIRAAFEHGVNFFEISGTQKT